MNRCWQRLVNGLVICVGRYWRRLRNKLLLYAIRRESPWLIAADESRDDKIEDPEPGSAQEGDATRESIGGYRRPRHFLLR